MDELLIAVAKNDVVAVLSRLKEGSSPDVRDADDRTALIHAVLGGKIEMINLLVRHGADVNARDINGFGALHFAAQEFQIAAAEVILQDNAEIDSQDKYGNTPLWRAVFHSRGRGEMIRLLLKYGANPHTKNYTGKSPVDLANTIGNYDVKQFFR